MDSKISNLNSATTLTDADVLPIVNGAETKKVTVAVLKSQIPVNADWNATTGKAQIINKPTIDLQSVIDNGSIASNANVILSCEGGAALTLSGGDGLGTFVSYASEEGGIAIRAINQTATAIRADGKIMALGGLGLSLYAESIDSSLTTNKDVDTANFVNNTLLDIDFLYDCSAINVNTLSADGIRVYTNSGIGTTINQGSSGKGLVVNGGASSVGNPISFNKNGVDKFTVNQAGDVTATKFVKQGGTSSELLIANGNTQPYRDGAEQTYNGTLSWTPTAPQTIVANTYKWNQVGSLVTVRINLVYTTAGSITQVSIPLPTDMPTPLSPTGLTGALDILYYGTGMFNTSTVAVANITRVAFLRRNTANTGYEFVVTYSAAIAVKVVHLTLQYFT